MLLQQQTAQMLHVRRYMYLALDEAGSHVGGHSFRLIAGAYETGQNGQLLGSGCSAPIRVLANNDTPKGAAFISIPITIRYCTASTALRQALCIADLAMWDSGQSHLASVLERGSIIHTPCVVTVLKAQDGVLRLVVRWEGTCLAGLTGRGGRGQHAQPILHRGQSAQHRPHSSRLQGDPHQSGPSVPHCWMQQHSLCSVLQAWATAADSPAAALAQALLPSKHHQRQCSCSLVRL